MPIPKFNPRTALLLLIIAAVAALRLVTHFSTELGPLAVFTPIGAMALFGGACFSGYAKPLAFPMLTLFISDVVLSFTVLSEFRQGLLYSGWYWTYAAFALMTLAGKWIIRDVTVGRLLLATLSATLIHWLVSDIGGCLHEPNAQAILTVYFQRLIAAIPFEWRFFAGTAIYSAVMFGVVEWMQRKYPELKKV